MAQLYSTIRLEGSLFTRDFLMRLGAPQSTLEQIKPESYGLAEGRLREAIGSSWNTLASRYNDFQEQLKKLPATDPATGVTRQAWILPLLEELRFGRVQLADNIEVTVDTAEGQKTKSYPISHAWNHVPMHLLGWNVPLDKRSPGVAGAAQTSPHALVQEALNRSSEHLWAMLCNGRKLRLLRDSAAIARQSYIEFDLETMFEHEHTSDFALLWMLCHASRFENREIGNREIGNREIGNRENVTSLSPHLPTSLFPGEATILETWLKTADVDGQRALDKLRDGVQAAIEAIATGFLQHSDNRTLREKLRSGELADLDYYRLNLRLVYRLLFVLVAEARDGLLLTGDEHAKARDTYSKYFSIERLKNLATRQRGGAHADGYEALKALWARLREGEKALAIPALNGFLFAPMQLDELSLPNSALYQALRALCFVEDDRGTRRAVNFQLDSQELGSVYESLLEMSPRIDPDASSFTFEKLAGNERKTTGSYYTPAGLVKSLLDSALEPVIEARLSLAGELANREMGNRGRDAYVRKFLSRPDGVAGSDDTGRGVLPSDENFPARGDVRHDIANTPGGKFDSGEHSRGLGPRGDKGVHTVSASGSGQLERTGNSSPTQLSRGTDGTTTDSRSSQQSDSNRQDDSFPDWFFTAQAEWRDIANREAANREKGGQQAAGDGHKSRDSPPISPPPYSLLAENALLSLKVCDPACGSGAFLTAAARRIARVLALQRCNGDEPSREETQRALRDVVGRCIFGVDLNPMAVELCKVALWMESLDPTRPLTFLDAHIRCGNALLGATPELLEDGIPDEAFAPLEGDDKAVCSELRKRNKKEREEELHQVKQVKFEFETKDKLDLGNLRAQILQMETQSDDTLEGLRAKERMLHALETSESYNHTHLLADAWCAAFVWKKVKSTVRAEKLVDNPDFIEPMTHETFRYIERNARCMHFVQLAEIKRLATQYRWFHWHLEFPAVFAEASSERRVANSDNTTHSPLTTRHAPATGFDVVLGNPPWERVKLQEKEWFAARVPEIANAPNANARKNLITELLQNQPDIHSAFLDARRQAEGESHFVRASNHYPLCGRGDVNTYALFAELNRQLIGGEGRVGCIVPSGIATDDTTKYFFQSLTQNHSLVSLFDFENREKIFPAVDSRMKFCLLTMSGEAATRAEAAFVFFATRVEHIDDPARRFALSAADIALLNPNTKTCPIFRSSRDAELTKAIYRRVPVLVDESKGEDGNPWNARIGRMFHKSDDSPFFQSTCSQDTLKLYESKSFWQFDHRYSHFDGLDYRELIGSERNANFQISTEYWIEKGKIPDKFKPKLQNYYLAYRVITNATNERTIVSAILPECGVLNSANVFIAAKGSTAAYLLSCLNSFVNDYICRQAMGGTNLHSYILKQLPVLAPTTYEAECPWSPGTTLAPWNSSRVLELTYTAHDMEPFARDLGYTGPPFAWDPERRFQLRCELDAAFFHLYGLSRDEAEYVMNTFPIVRRKDEKEFGEYRTARVILENYDKMARGEVV